MIYLYNGREESERGEGMEAFGFALRLAREKHGLTQKQVMALTGINNKTLSGYENGVAQPDLKTLTELLKLYGVSPNRFFGWQEGPREELSGQEEQLLKLCRALSEREKEELLAALRAVLRCREK